VPGREGQLFAGSGDSPLRAAYHPGL